MNLECDTCGGMHFGGCPDPAPARCDTLGREIWIAWIATGEYEDHEARVLKCFFTCESAEAHKARFKLALREAGLHVDQDGSPEYRGNDLDYRHEQKARFGRIDYTGAWIFVTGPHELEP